MKREELLRVVIDHTEDDYNGECIMKAIDDYIASNFFGGELPYLSKARSCANCKRFIDKYPFSGECSLHGKLANITHPEEQCCDNWEK